MNTLKQNGSPVCITGVCELLSVISKKLIETARNLQLGHIDTSLLELDPLNVVIIS